MTSRKLHFFERLKSDYDAAVQEFNEREDARLAAIDKVECTDCDKELGRGQKKSYEAKMCRACRKRREKK